MGFYLKAFLLMYFFCTPRRKAFGVLTPFSEFFKGTFLREKTFFY